LMFCMRGPRIKNVMHQNWKLFNDILCKKEVPIVLVVTGLENEENMDGWWWTNKEAFEAQGIRPDGTACITAIRGRTLRDGISHAFDEQYDESRAKLATLMLNRVLVRARKVEKIAWFYDVTHSFFFFFRWTTKHEAKEIREIADACGMSEEDAREFAQLCC